jgi:hypothetical protein
MCAACGLLGLLIRDRILLADRKGESADLRRCELNTQGTNNTKDRIKATIKCVFTCCGMRTGRTRDTTQPRTMMTPGNTLKSETQTRVKAHLRCYAVRIWTIYQLVCTSAPYVYSPSCACLLWCHQLRPQIEGLCEVLSYYTASFIRSCKLVSRIRPVRADIVFKISLVLLDALPHRALFNLHARQRAIARRCPLVGRPF